jgi:Mce-associated membrane protein
MVRLARVLFALSVVAAGWFGWTWYSAASARPPAAEQVRDQVLEIGEQAVINVSSLNYHHLAAGLRLWKQSSTGPFLAGITAGEKQLERAVTQARTVTTARVLDGALTSLKPSSATFIVAEETTVTAASGKPSTIQYRLRGELARTRAGWKLSQLAVVPTGQAAR